MFKFGDFKRCYFLASFLIFILEKGDYYMNEMTMNILMVLGGLGLFLYGIDLMGEGLKRSAGNKMRMLIEKTTNTPLKAILMGFLITVLLQTFFWYNGFSNRIS